MSTQTELQHQNERPELLLNLSNKITSNLDLREVIYAISGNLREVMRGDLAAVSLLDETTGRFRLCALDFPKSKDLLREGLPISPTNMVRRAVETLQSVVIGTNAADQFPPEVHAELAQVVGTKSV